MSSEDLKHISDGPSVESRAEIILPEPPPAPTTLEEALVRISRLEAELRSTRGLAKDFGHMLVEEFVGSERRGVELIAANERADLDDKTGLYKPTVFEQRVRQITASARRRGDTNRVHGLILADMDGFGILNTMLTHIENDDRYLKPFSGIMKEEVGKAGIACRFGGDEFAIFLHDASLLESLSIASTIQQRANAMELPDKVHGRNYLGISMGIVRFHQGNDYNKVFYKANRLLILAKKTRNQIVTEDVAWQDI